MHSVSPDLSRSSSAMRWSIRDVHVRERRDQSRPGCGDDQSDVGGRCGHVGRSGPGGHRGRSGHGNRRSKRTRCVTRMTTASRLRRPTICRHAHPCLHPARGRMRRRREFYRPTALPPVTAPVPIPPNPIAHLGRAHVFQGIDSQGLKVPIGTGNPVGFRADWSPVGSSVAGAVADLAGHHS